MTGGADETTPTPVLLSWSGGKDSALALARLRSDPSVHVVGLLTTVTTGYDRISIHGVRRALLRLQAASVGVPVHEIEIEPGSSNERYQAAWAAALRGLPASMRRANVIAFGDIFLEDVRAYREDLVRAVDFDAIFPLWGEPTQALASEVLDRGFAARIVCIDTHVLPAGLAGAEYDAAFLSRLPAAVDPCGERGEFHTFVSAGPVFREAVGYRLGEAVLRDDRFAYRDLVPASNGRRGGEPGPSPRNRTR